MILGLIDEARAAGARQSKACEVIGLDVRTLQRWKSQGIGEDGRAGPKTPPANKLTAAERKRVLEVVNEPAHRDLSINQIVPLLADQGEYIASESTMYRILGEEGQLQHRSPTRPRTHERPRELVATGPNQVWCWDITYLKSPISGVYFYAYLVTDVFSRKIVGRAVHDTEDQLHAAALVQAACAAEGVEPGTLVIHSDNGGPMKGATMLATLQRLGVVPSFSRPQVSDDNPHAEALFRTMKYRPEYPRGAFESLEAAWLWVEWFVGWYNTEHRHSAIRFVTPGERHEGRDAEILERRREVYEQARQRNPQRWARGVRDWTPAAEVVLNPRDTARRQAG